MEFGVWLAQLACKVPAGVEMFWACKGLDFSLSLQFPLAKEPLRPAGGVTQMWVTAVTDHPRSQWQHEGQGHEVSHTNAESCHLPCRSQGCGDLLC